MFVNWNNLNTYQYTVVTGHFSRGGRENCHKGRWPASYPTGPPCGPLALGTQKAHDHMVTSTSGTAPIQGRMVPIQDRMVPIQDRMVPIQDRMVPIICTMPNSVQRQILYNAKSRSVQRQILYNAKFCTTLNYVQCQIVFKCIQPFKVQFRSVKHLKWESISINSRVKQQCTVVYGNAEQYKVVHLYKSVAAYSSLEQYGTIHQFNTYTLLSITVYSSSITQSNAEQSHQYLALYCNIFISCLDVYVMFRCFSHMFISCLDVYIMFGCLSHGESDANDFTVI
ncbi:hypothetical protein Btru_057324 [Bulinus truncatus]|nr:hypothetical protein Btru_057324 [Bulinus truncatus]